MSAFVPSLLWNRLPWLLRLYNEELPEQEKQRIRRRNPLPFYVRQSARKYGRGNPL